MANDRPAPAGPDLEAGVPLAELPEGEPFVRHARGEPVLLVRRGGEVLGVGAACTHYGAPLADSRALIRAAGAGRRAVVLGAGFIGMEVAASLRSRGLDVVVVAPESVPFERTLGPELGAVLRELQEDHAVAFRPGRIAAEIEPGRVRLDDGTELPADVVVVGIGVRPSTGLAEAAGVTVDDGVRVGAYLETSAPGIFAAGDIARWHDPGSGEWIRSEHWVVAQRQGQVAARNIPGQRVPFRSPPFFWTRQWDVSVAYVGHAREWSETRVEGYPAAHDCAVRYLAGGRTLAVATIGRDRDSLVAEAALEAAAAEPVAAGPIDRGGPA